MPRSIARPGLTLIEALVVMGIIGVLIALLIPVVQKARATSGRASCTGNLHQLGIAFEMFREVNQGKYPDAAMLPSATPSRPRLSDVLANFVEHNSKIFRCPSDGKYFAQEGTSYEYPSPMLANKRLEDLLATGRMSSDRIALLYDYEGVHGSRGSGNSRNFLFADGHVE